ncbi:Agbl5 [Symbiodinium sp. CCMP2456]|nr:Agbl5 [Symbiodinium sp. CCMP2456]
MGEVLFQRATKGQWGHQVQQGMEGIHQAQRAVRNAMGATAMGDIDWVVSGWGDAVAVLLEDVETLLEEEGQLDFVHPSDVAALDEGAAELPPTRGGQPGEQLAGLIRDIEPS